MKRYSIFLYSKWRMLYLFCLIPINTLSQNSIAVFGGMTSNYLQTNYSNRPFTQSKSKTGVNFGVSLHFYLDNLFEIGTGLIVLNKNHTIRRTGDYSGAYESSIRTYVQVPLYISVKKQSNKMAFNLDLGPYGAWWTSGRLKGKLPDIFATINNGNGETIPLRSYSEKYEFTSSKDRRIEWGGMIALGASYHLTQKVAAVIDLTYFHALTGGQKRYSINLTEDYNRTISISAGIKFILKK